MRCVWQIGDCRHGYHPGEHLEYAEGRLRAALRLPLGDELTFPDFPVQEGVLAYASPPRQRQVSLLAHARSTDARGGTPVFALPVPRENSALGRRQEKHRDS